MNRLSGGIKFVPTNFQCLPTSLRENDNSSDVEPEELPMEEFANSILNVSVTKELKAFNQFAVKSSMAPNPFDISNFQVKPKTEIVVVKAEEPTSSNFIEPTQPLVNESKINLETREDSQESNALEMFSWNLDYSHPPDSLQEVSSPMLPLWMSASKEEMNCSKPPPFAHRSDSFVFVKTYWPICSHLNTTISVAIKNYLSEYQIALQTTEQCTETKGKKSKLSLMPKSVGKKRTLNTKQNITRQAKTDYFSNISSSKLHSVPGTLTLPANILKTYKERLEKSTYRPPLAIAMLGLTGAGKSTCIGRLLFESGQVTEDQVKHIEWEAKKFCQSMTQGEMKSQRSKIKHKFVQQMSSKEMVNWSWLVDQSQAERLESSSFHGMRETLMLHNRKVHFMDTPGRSDARLDQLATMEACDAALVVIPHDICLTTELPLLLHQLFMARAMTVRQFLILFNVKSHAFDPQKIQHMQSRIHSQLLCPVFYKLNDSTASRNDDVSVHFGTMNLLDNSIRIGDDNLFAHLDHFTIRRKVNLSPQTLVEMPFVLQVDDIFKPINSSGWCVSGTVLSGAVKTNMNDVYCWNGRDVEEFTIKGISQADLVGKQEASIVNKSGGCSNLATQEESLTYAFPDDYICANIVSSLSCHNGLLTHSLGHQPLLLTSLLPRQVQYSNVICVNVILHSSTASNNALLYQGMRLDMLWRQSVISVNVKAIQQFEPGRDDDDEEDGFASTFCSSHGRHKRIVWRLAASAQLQLKCSQPVPFLAFWSQNLRDVEAKKTANHLLSEYIVLAQHSEVIATGKLMEDL